MKNITSILKKGLLVLFICASNLITLAQSSATLQPDRAGLCVGDTIHVPIHLTGTDIYQTDFYIDYNHSVLSLTTPQFTNLYPGFSISITDPLGTYSNVLYVSIYITSGFNGVTFTGQKITDLVFTYIGGPWSTTMHLRKSGDPTPPNLCGIWDSFGTPLTPYSFTDNTVSGSSPLPVSVSIAASANPVCAGTSVTFTATPTNGGTTPSYQWKVNGTNVGTDNPVYSYIPTNGDIVTCVLTSNATCATDNPATSNPITMTVNPNLPVSV